MIRSAPELSEALSIEQQRNAIFASKLSGFLVLIPSG
jgi:hypothetical protein